MRQNELRPARGAKHKPKRVGRGFGSGHGATATRGTKGQKARSGGKIHPRFEGGQLPLIHRLPQKRGFTNIFRLEYSIVNLERLTVFEPYSQVTPQELQEKGIIKSLRKPVKVLGRGEVHHPLLVKASKFSAAARKKIEAAGGKAEEVAHAAGVS